MSDEPKEYDMSDAKKDDKSGVVVVKNENKNKDYNDQS